MAVLKAVQTVYLLVASKADMMAVLMVALMAELMVAMLELSKADQMAEE